MTRPRLPVLSPFDLKKEEIEAFTGELTSEQMLIVRAVLNGIKATIHIPMNNGMKHDDMCWGYGPAHYICAYNKIRELSATTTPMTNAQIAELTEYVDCSLQDLTRIVRAVEHRHNIGLAT